MTVQLASNQATCRLQLTTDYNQRGGVTRVEQGYLIVIDDEVGLACEDCRRVLRRRLDHQVVGPKPRPRNSREELPSSPLPTAREGEIP